MISSVNSGSSGDYHLTLNPNGGVSSDMITIGSNNKGIITIPKGKDSVIVYVMPNGDNIFEPDETAVLKIDKSYAAGVNPNDSKNWFDLGTTTATVTILQAPEFISQADPNPLPNPPAINQDFYTFYFDKNAAVGTVLTGTKPINAMAHRSVTYAFLHPMAL